MSEIDSGNEKIKIGIKNEKAFVWLNEDISKLRVDYRICGSLIGTLANIQQQNVFLGPPLLLLPEEAWLLVIKNLAVFVDMSNVPFPSESEIKKYHQERKDHIKRDVEITKNKSDGKVQLTPSEIERRQFIRNERMASKNLNNAHNDVVNVNIGNSDNDNKDTLPNTFTITIPSINIPSVEDPNIIYENVEDAKKANIFTYPNNELEVNKCLVFKDLWDKGFYMGDGLRFGGHFLVYPGDPLRYHSHYTITVIQNMKTTINPMEIVAYGRLGTTVKKVHVLATYNNEQNKVDYISLEWAGFGT